MKEKYFRIDKIEAVHCPMKQKLRKLSKCYVCKYHEKVVFISFFDYVKCNYNAKT